MSTVCGIVNHEGRPVRVAQLRAMLGATADRSPDGQQHWIKGGVGLGFGTLHTTADLRSAQQPLNRAEIGLCLSFAGNVNNRQDLRNLLGKASREPEGGSDPDLVLRSYSSWQEGCLDKIIGEFILALWDAQRQRLFCARDLVGTKPFYYCATPHAFYFASEIRQLLALPEIRRDPNEGMLGEYLLSRMVSRTETQFRGIMRLPPANYLVVENGRVAIREYWDPSGIPSVEHQDDRELAEHLLELMRIAVGSRMRSHEKVGVQLSGGVDSSSLVAVAADLELGRGLDCPGFSALSLIFPGWDCDEGEFIDAVEAKTGVTTRRIEPERFDNLHYSQQVAKYSDYPDYPNGSMSDPLERAASERGIRVMLTGLGGDEWFQRPDLHLADLLRRGRLVEAARWTRSLPDRTWSPIRQHPLFTHGLFPLLPTWIMRQWRRLRSRPPLPSWIEPDFAASNNLLDRLHQPLEWRAFGDLAAAESYRAAMQGFQTHAIEMEERSAAGFHLELRYPFHDRRIIEFGMGLTPDQRWRNGLHKFVLRQAMEGLLPDRVRQRTSKAEFSRVFVEALLAVGRERFEDLTIAEAGWVRSEGVLTMYDRLVDRFRTEGSCQGPELWPLWSIHGADLWHREVCNIREESDGVGW